MYMSREVVACGEGGGVVKVRGPLLLNKILDPAVETRLDLILVAAP